MGDAGRGPPDGREATSSPARVGPLFGAVLARAHRRRWEELDRPDPFVVIGGRRRAPGTLALSVLAAGRCAPAAALRAGRALAELARQACHLALADPAEVLGPPGGDPDDGVPSPAAGSGPSARWSRAARRRGRRRRDRQRAARQHPVPALRRTEFVPDGEAWAEVASPSTPAGSSSCASRRTEISARLDVLAPTPARDRGSRFADGLPPRLHAALGVLNRGSVLVVRLRGGEHRIAGGPTGRRVAAHPATTTAASDRSRIPVPRTSPSRSPSTSSP